MTAISGPAVLSIIALVVFFGAAIVIGVLADRNSDRRRSRGER
jgi:hypothetical protein